MHNDLLGGTILFAIDTLPQNVQFQKSGKFRLLAVTSTKRAAMAPDVPTVLEFGYPKLVAENFFGISGPANVPKTVIDPLHKATMSALDDPKLVKNFETRHRGAQDVAGGVHGVRAKAGERVGARGEGVRRQAQLD